MEIGGISLEDRAASNVRDAESFLQFNLQGSELNRAIGILRSEYGQPRNLGYFAESAPTTIAQQVYERVLP